MNLIYTLTFLALSAFTTNPVFSAEINQEPTVLKTNDGITLSGSWTLPASAKAAVLILQGSGTVGMDGDVSGPFLGTGYKGQPALLSKQIADALAAEGVASLRYDKRGFTDPSQVQNQTAQNLTQDALSALAMINARFPGLKQGIVGFSEGAVVAIEAASAHPVNELFLLSTPTRSMDELFAYQFIQWPVALLKNRLDQSGVRTVSANSITPLVNEPLPLAGAPLSSLGLNQDGSLDVFLKATQYYENYFQSLLPVLATPDYRAWYDTFEALPPFVERAKKITVPVKLYQSTEDAQLDWGWILAAQSYFSGKTSLQFYPGVGHCFSPMEGDWGQIKTSGPMSPEVLNDLSHDVQEGLTSAD